MKAISKLYVSTLALGLAILISATAQAEILFDQMTNFSPTIITTSWLPPDGFDGDTYSYDNFLLPFNSAITEVWWVGGGGTITGLTVRFYTGLAGAPDLQPTITALPENETPADYLRGYTFTGNGNQTPIPGTSLFQYHVVLPTALSLPGNTVFWIKIEGDAVGYPSWGLATATHGRDSRHITYYTGLHQFLPQSTSDAFQLLGTTIPVPSAVASRKLHAGIPLDIDLPLTGNPGIERRSGGATNDYQIVLTFANPVTFTGAAVTTGTGTVGGTDGNGTPTVTVNLTGVTNAQAIAVTVSNLSDGTNTGDLIVPMDLLVGDTNGNGTVNAADVAQTKSHLGQVVDATNFRSDVNANGSINAADTAIVKQKSGTSLPP